VLRDPANLLAVLKGGRLMKDRLGTIVTA